MYPVEHTLTSSEETIVFRIRQLIGDEKEVFVDDIQNLQSSNAVSANGTMYQLEEPKGYPMEVYIDGLEYSQNTNPEMLSYKFLKFKPTVSGSPIGPLASGNTLTVLYNHFRHSDLEIINTYDTSAMSFLVDQGGLDQEDIGIDLMILATAYLLLMNDLNLYIKESVTIKDSDSEFSTGNRASALKDLLKAIADKINHALDVKISGKMLGLQVKKVE